MLVNNEDLIGSLSNGEKLILKDSADNRYVNSWFYVSIARLTGPTPPVPKRTFMTLRLLHIVPGHASGVFKGGKKEIQNPTYSRLYLCTDAYSRTGRVCYLGVNAVTNNKLWTRNTTYRDDVTLVIGCVFVLPNPFASPNLYSNDISMVESKRSAIMCKPPRRTTTVDINKSIKPGDTRFFTLNGVMVESKSLAVETTKCCGWVCDHQGVMEIKSDSNKVCSCFSINAGSRSSLAFIHRLKIMDIEGNHIFTVNNFISNKFSEIYLNGQLHCRLHESRVTDDLLDDITEACDEVLDAINMDQGFLVMGWYKKGTINNSSSTIVANNLTKQEKVDAGNVNYHITTITAYNKKIAKNYRYNVNRLNR